MRPFDLCLGSSLCIWGRTSTVAGVLAEIAGSSLLINDFIRNSVFLYDYIFEINYYFHFISFE